MKLWRRRFLGCRRRGRPSRPAGCSRIAFAQAYPVAAVALVHRRTAEQLTGHRHTADRAERLSGTTSASPSSSKPRPGGGRQYRHPRQSINTPARRLRATLYHQRRHRRRRDASTTTSASISCATSCRYEHRPRAFVMVVEPVGRRRNHSSLIAYAKANPSKLTLTSSGKGTVEPCRRRTVEDDDRSPDLSVPYRSGPARTPT